MAEEKKTKKRGRPPKKKLLGRPKESFEPWDNWQEDICNLYAEGASDVEVRGLIIEKMKGRDSLTWHLWDSWLKDEPIFLETIKMGRTLSQIWWEREGRVNLKDRDFSPPLWFMNMRNRFGWGNEEKNKPSEPKDKSAKDMLKEIAEGLPD